MSAELRRKELTLLAGFDTKLNLGHKTLWIPEMKLLPPDHHETLNGYNYISKRHVSARFVNTTGAGK